MFAKKEHPHLSVIIQMLCLFVQSSLVESEWFPWKLKKFNWGFCTKCYRITQSKFLVHTVGSNALYTWMIIYCLLEKLFVEIQSIDLIL